ncbi:uL13 family ribosomal protein [Candidatus Vidania fulgoroideorum]
MNFNIYFKNKSLGRLCSVISKILINNFKYKKSDKIKIIEFKNFIINGNKKKKCFYYKHTGFPGGLKKIKIDDKKKIFLKFIKGMINNKKINKKIFKYIIFK